MVTQYCAASIAENVRIWSRKGKDWSKKFLNVVEAVKVLKVTTVRPLQIRSTQIRFPKV